MPGPNNGWVTELGSRPLSFSCQPLWLQGLKEIVRQAMHHRVKVIMIVKTSHPLLNYYIRCAYSFFYMRNIATSTLIILILIEIVIPFVHRLGTPLPHTNAAPQVSPRGQWILSRMKTKPSGNLHGWCVHAWDVSSWTLIIAHIYHSIKLQMNACFSMYASHPILKQPAVTYRFFRNDHAVMNLRYPNCLWFIPWGDDPFDMHAAAQQLEDLSYGFVDQTFLDVSWWGLQKICQKLVNPVCFKFFGQHLILKASGFPLRALPQLGGAVGRSAWPVVQGRDLEAVTYFKCVQNMVSHECLLCIMAMRDTFKPFVAPIFIPN